MTATALIAEDEPLLAADLQAGLTRLWPSLRIVASVRHGAAAVEQALALRPDVVFLDIRMPGLSGLEAAQAMTEDWPDAHALPLIVFVTAYDEYALRAFEHAAVDYVLKPVQPERLAQTCARVQAACKARGEAAPPDAAALEATLGRLRSLPDAPGLVAAQAHAQAPKLSVIQAAVGDAVHLVPVADVLYFEAAEVRARGHRRARIPDPHFAARVAAAARRQALLASAPRHGGARRCDCKRSARCVVGQGAADAARPRGQARRQPLVRASVQSDVAPRRQP
jgi:DNA-binding LytR/AlgR family response regulator